MHCGHHLNGALESPELFHLAAKGEVKRLYLQGKLSDMPISIELDSAKKRYYIVITTLKKKGCFSPVTTEECI